MIDKDLNKFITLLCEAYSLRLENSSEEKYRIFTDHASGITIFLEFSESLNFSFYFLQRTYDVVYNGDRSDAHVILSLMFASFLRQVSNGISCSFFDIAHPVIENEIWGRYIMPEQKPSFLGISSKEKLYGAVTEIIQIVALWRTVFWEFAGCPCDDCMSKINVNKERDYDVPLDLMESIKKIYKTPKHSNYGGRIRPEWRYLYDIDHEITIIESHSLSTYLHSIIRKCEREPVKIDGKNGTLFIDGELKNFIHNKSFSILDKLVKNLKGKIGYHIIPFENMVIAVANPYVIALGRLSGFPEFKAEREILRDRHNKEAELLFPISEFVWKNVVCAEQFEKLIKALLEREPNVKNVRIPAPINQGDKGRDLIIEWNVIDEKFASQVSPPSILLKVVGQCKATNKTVGKNSVLDIRDTVETHNSQGYFLAVSTQITAPLTEKLEELKSKGIWTEWWNREEIETRLSKNQDLIPLFPEVFSVKNTVKFVNKD